MAKQTQKSTLSSTQKAAKLQAKINEAHVEEQKPAKKTCKPKKTTLKRKKDVQLPQSPKGLTKTEIKALAEFVANKLDDGKAENVQIIDLKGKSSFTDFLVVASGTSSRHLNGLCNNLVEDLKKSNFRVRVSGDTGDSGWIVIDLIDVMVHIFTPETREFYDLEGMWKEQLKS